jgi:two-component system CheB/CheR fusion protein
MPKKISEHTKKNEVHPAAEGNPSTPKDSPDHLVVGLGASAGGLEAFKAFFQNMPADTGMAFVVVQHLDPTHKSMLSELLSHYTKMQVLEALDKTKVKPNTVYTIPPNKELRIRNGKLQLMAPFETKGYRRTIDYFLRSLAEDQKENAVGIILSGTGTEGANGLKAIKGRGGLAIVQDPKSAKYEYMPQNAIASNAADAVLPAEKMPEYLIRYLKGRAVHEIVQEVTVSPQRDFLEKIFRLLKDHSGNNFSHYKVSTIKRRINKRMMIKQIQTVEGYWEHLNKVPEEVDLLFQDLLIGVTSFFRNKEAFESLAKEVIPKIVNSKNSGDSIRVWVPGCSSGEEAYTIAILFDEAVRKSKKNIDLQVFASDIDEEAINIARAGMYPESIAADVGSKRLNNYFELEQGFCKVKKKLRDKIIFARQNLINDPPFSRLDLISCRNLLIYLTAKAQQQILSVFHYSLVPEGFLFLGTSETIGSANHLFKTLDRKHKIHVRKPGIVKRQPQMEFTTIGLDHSIQKKGKPELAEKTPGTKLAELTLRQLLADYAPPCVIINEKNTALYFFSNTGKYLQPAEGEPSLDILDMARVGLKAGLRIAINKVRKSRQEVIREYLKVKTNGSYQTINLKVKPLSQPELGEQLLMVVFEDTEAPTGQPVASEPLANGELEHVVELEHELASTKEYLNTMIEELGIANEELKSANEELQSANEELQSTNEELETSKEELQSMNEEMVTVNTELQAKIDELSYAHDDMANLLASTQIGTIFLGSNLEIRRYTPAISTIMNILPTDIGRPVSHLSTNLVDCDLTADAQKVLADLVAIKKVIQSESGNRYHMQITPYRTVANVIDGVVMTFFDVTEEKMLEEKLQKNHVYQNLTMEILSAVPFTCSPADGLRFLFVGDGADKLLGFSPDRFVSEPNFWIDRIHRNDRKKVLEGFRNIPDNATSTLTFRWKCANGKYKQLLNHLRIFKSPTKEQEQLLAGIWQDISELDGPRTQHVNER